MSRKKLSKSDYAALNAGRPVTVLPPGGGRAQLRMQGPPRTRKKGGR